VKHGAVTTKIFRTGAVQLLPNTSPQAALLACLRQMETTRLQGGA